MRRRRGLSLPPVRALVFAVVLLVILAVSFTTIGAHILPLAETHLDRIGLIGNSCQWDSEKSECVGELRKCRTVKDKGLCGAITGCGWTGDGYCVDGPVNDPTCKGLSQNQCEQVS